MAFEVVTRPAQTLCGKMWEGSYDAAAAGHVKEFIADMERLRSRLAAGHEGEASGLVGISFNDIPGGFRYLVALPPQLAPRSGLALSAFSFPSMRFAAVWHEAADGDVFAHYERMFAWIEAQGLRRVTDVCHHREEYPPQPDLHAPPRLRLMTPVA
ncbi:GyrI-like domain-containing protein [Chelativorans intermedius]|uniref:GyrI-like domain-containing protein n=1 Tax=Chelativorans intermedius TaxID=515947 RepID=A0ABV6D317_9HYPH|nr:GyrI-like domain-containing protein [Chelativorans intermedius]MCT8998465.1 GyrI-like domain-containing protein [Chelativorans intermedius]